MAKHWKVVAPKYLLRRCAHHLQEDLLQLGAPTATPQPHSPTLVGATGQALAAARTTTLTDSKSSQSGVCKKTFATCVCACCYCGGEGLRARFPSSCRTDTRVSVCRCGLRVKKRRRKESNQRSETVRLVWGRARRRGGQAHNEQRRLSEALREYEMSSKRSQVT